MFNMMRLAAAAMMDNAPDENGERGVIVTTASIAAFDGQIGQVAYAARKAGVSGLTLPVARELSKFGIRVVCVAPGLFDTPINAGASHSCRSRTTSSTPLLIVRPAANAYANTWCVGLTSREGGLRIVGGDTRWCASQCDRSCRWSALEAERSWHAWAAERCIRLPAGVACRKVRRIFALAAG